MNGRIIGCGIQAMFLNHVGLLMLVLSCIYFLNFRCIHILDTAKHIQAYTLLIVVCCMENFRLRVLSSSSSPLDLEIDGV